MGGAVAAAFAARSSIHKAAAAASPTWAALPQAGGNTLVQMQANLDRALAKPPETRSWVMVVDTHRCVGCNACAVACREEMVTGPAGSYRRVKRLYWQCTGVFRPAYWMQSGATPNGRITTPE